MTTAIYPGSFDPVTFGHLDVVARAADVFERVVVALLVNTKKSPLWSTEDRLACLREAVDEALDGRDAARVEMVAFEGLTVDAARRVEARFIVRGLRAVSDFESEMQMAHTNRKLAPEVDTVFFMTALEHAYLSSSLVREISLLGGDVSGMVPPAVTTRLRAMTGVG
jgi:pantetheine-phosphate adenylyltransferase